MTTPSADIIDLLAGIAPSDPLAAVREKRAQARENAQRSFEALLEPAEPGTFALAERYALASFVSQLHGFDAATAFYGDLLGDETPALTSVVASAAASAAATGPFGAYREPRLQAESTDGVRWTPDAATASAWARDCPARSRTHICSSSVRARRAPRRFRTSWMPGGAPDDIVSLSQLIAFLSFQLRVAWGLRALAAASAPVAASATVSEGA